MILKPLFLRNKPGSQEFRIFTRALFDIGESAAERVDKDVFGEYPKAFFAVRPAEAGRFRQKV